MDDKLFLFPGKGSKVREEVGSGGHQDSKRRSGESLVFFFYVLMYNFHNKGGGGRRRFWFQWEVEKCLWFRCSLVSTMLFQSGCTFITELGCLCIGLTKLKASTGTFDEIELGVIHTHTFPRSQSVPSAIGMCCVRHPLWSPSALVHHNLLQRIW